MSKVTVVIANHNYGEYLEGAIESALAQTYQNLNVAVCDDASTDHSMQVLKKYRKNPRVDVLNNRERSGPSFTRNRIITKHLDSDYFAILDSDDAMHNTKVEKMLAQTALSDGVGVVYADYDNLNPLTNLAIREFKASYSREKLFNNCIVHSGSLISKNALVEHRLGDDQFYDNSFPVCEDWELWLRLSKTYMFIHLPEILTVVRVTNKNTSNTVQQNVWQECWARLSKNLEAGYYN